MTADEPERTSAFNALELCTQIRDELKRMQESPSDSRKRVSIGDTTSMFFSLRADLEEVQRDIETLRALLDDLTQDERREA